VVILDNLKTGHKENVHPKAAFYLGDKGDAALLDKIFTEHQIDTVLDFAGLIQVGESVKEPGKYFQNNLGKRRKKSQLILMVSLSISLRK